VRVTEAFHAFWSAWNRREMELASACTTHWLWQSQQAQVEELTALGLEHIRRVVRITGITPIFKWLDGTWRLDLIEDGSEESEYVFMPNEVETSISPAESG
jgi:hypothetical protein